MGLGFRNPQEHALHNAGNVEGNHESPDKSRKYVFSHGEQGNRSRARTWQRTTAGRPLNSLYGGVLFSGKVRRYVAWP